MYSRLKNGPGKLVSDTNFMDPMRQVMSDIADLGNR
jgi:hypothetical protein